MWRVFARRCAIFFVFMNEIKVNINVHECTRIFTIYHDLPQYCTYMYNKNRLSRSESRLKTPKVDCIVSAICDKGPGEVRKNPKSRPSVSY